MIKYSQPLLPHQQRVVDRILQPDQHGLILWHGLGSGKTRSSIEALKALNPKNPFVVLPKALEENYYKELDKWGVKNNKLKILSQQLLGRLDDVDSINPDLLIVDEAHRARTPGANINAALGELANKSKKTLLLTGTPVYNKPTDIASLVNMAAGDHVIPTSDSSFEDKYIKKTLIKPSLWNRIRGMKPGVKKDLKNVKELKNILKKYIDYYPGSAENFPEVSKETVKVDMSPKQIEIYNTALRKLPWVVRKKIQMGMPANKRETDKLVAFLSGLRALSNSSNGLVTDKNDVHSPKIEKAHENLKELLKTDPKYKAIVYSNFLDNGVNIYKELLERDKIPYGEFTGEIKNKVRDRLVKDYNADKLKVLLLSSAGGEGLDLKGTRLVQLLEPHFNNEKINQVIGRAARYKSHDHLPKDKQKVLIQHYLSQLPETGWLFKKRDMSTDEYLEQMSNEKQRLNNQVLDLVKD